MDSITLIGTSGAAICLVAFVLTQFHEWEGDYLIYEFFNFLGSLLLLIYAVYLNSYPFIVLNTIWGGVALWYVFVDLKRNMHMKNNL
ncbi:hypothetical protein HZA45_00105, partial [Candidatus Peregrinibacteria bacterium]|nr:hypothetical protein [Candidatus Peregrinibacteria bacterium]